jgi:hypothetical protein
MPLATSRDAEWQGCEDTGLAAGLVGHHRAGREPKPLRAHRCEAQCIGLPPCRWRELKWDAARLDPQSGDRVGGPAILKGCRPQPPLVRSAVQGVSALPSSLIAGLSPRQSRGPSTSSQQPRSIWLASMSSRPLVVARLPLAWQTWRTGRTEPSFDPLPTLSGQSPSTTSLMIEWVPGLRESRAPRSGISTCCST